MDYIMFAGVTAVAALSTDVVRAQAPILKNFGFGKAALSFTGTTPTDCGTLMVTAINAEPFGPGFRNVPNGESAKVTLAFQRPVSQLDIGLTYVRSDEYITEFNVKPTGASGSLTLAPDRVTTTRPFPADDGAGVVTWLEPGATISFVVGGPAGTALAVEGFKATCKP